MAPALTKEEEALHLINAVQEIALARDLASLTNIVKHAARKLSGADGVTFVLREAEHCYYVDEDAISPLWKGSRFPLETCISGWSMTHHEVVVIEDIYKDSRIPHDVYRPTFVKSLAMIPVRSRDPIAAIGAYWADTHRATPQELVWLQSVADTTAVALENIQLISALQEQVAESTRLLEQFKDEVLKRERVEDQLRQSQKLEAIGRLAGGVAHDFNNLLTVINSYSDVVLENVREGEPMREDVEEIRTAGDKAAALTRQLLAFGRKQILQPKVVELNEAVRSMDSLLRRVLPENIDIMTNLAPNLASVLADPGQLEQIIMNLVINARDAMPNGGKLTIETNNITLDEEYASEHQGAQPGPHVMLAVSDTGTGMDAETQNRIFDPFFTTKAMGKGTGLGLFTVYGIVKQSGGNIWVYSELDRGTTFKIYLPRAEQPAEKRTETRKAPAIAKGTGTLLLVEDDDMVRRLVHRVLAGGGYTVLAVANAHEAQRVARDYEQPIELLIADVVLPDVSGPELTAQLVEIRPELSVLYMSGYTNNAVIHQGVLDQEVSFIEKPLTPSALLRKVQDVLVRSDANTSV